MADGVEPALGVQPGALPGMYCGTDTTNAPDSIAMCRIEASQPSESSAVGATQICGCAW